MGKTEPGMIHIIEYHVVHDRFAFFPSKMEDGTWQWMTRYKIVQRNIRSEATWSTYVSDTYNVVCFIKMTCTELLKHTLSGTLHADGVPWKYSIPDTDESIAKWEKDTF